MLFFLAACSLEKESAVNRGLQNLTAHYNILFNANQILQQKQLDYEQTYIDNYAELLSIYRDTVAVPATDKDLDAAIAKANNIIAIKEQSHYIGDAYLVLGKANHLYRHYYNAVEYFRYVVNSFPKRADLKQEARIWQVRSLIYLNQMPEARSVLDSVLKNAEQKKGLPTDAYATATAFDMETGAYPDAEQHLKLALKHTSSSTQRLRWTFILAQLQELNHEPADAYANYMRVEKSNASFELSFNANLNRIRLEDARQGVGLTRMQRLIRLLRDDKNAEFIDQIYYQMALLNLANNDIDAAVKNLQLSVRKSTRNQNQKGLSYLRLADINFKNKGNYVAAKKYYDSTLTSLSPSYPEYTLIQKKAENLQVLADRLHIISYEDTLQTLAKLDEATRKARLDEMAANHLKQMQAAEQQAAASGDPFASQNSPFNNLGMTTPQGNQNTTTGSSFYFYNAGAVSQGFTDFKKRWGNRHLEDNWRRSKRSNSNMTANATNLAQNVDQNTVPNQIQKSAEGVAAHDYRQVLEQSIPRTPEQIDHSNQRIYNAYLDIANFYRDILQDKKEAVESYETLLSRFPNDPNKSMIYYNLYRLYTELNDPKASIYRDLLLKDFPNSVYAKVITDPDYARKLDDKDAEFNAFYNQVYDLVAGRQYAEAITRADALLKQYPDNKLAPQLAYLRVIANGHQEKLEPFRAELLAVTTAYPNDRLIVPLINEHILYIDANKEAMAKRPFALMDNDPNEAPFIPAMAQQPAPQLAQNKPVQSVPAPAKPAIAPAKPTAVTPPAVTPPVVTVPVIKKPVDTLVNNKPVTAPTKLKPTDTIASVPPPVTTPPANNPPQTIAPPAKPVEEPSIFNMRDSTHYYFVVNVATATTNLASSRFGIGQYNRVNYASAGIKHQLKDVGADNQLIYVGVFNNLETAKVYTRGIIPLMPQIMKVPADKYSFFIITQENLNKLADKKTLDSYVSYYQKNY